MPTIHSRPSRISMKQQVVPRSGSSITSKVTSANPGSSGTNRCRARRSVPSCCLRASRSAPHSSIADLGQLGGLQLQRADVDPAARAVDADADAGHQHRDQRDDGQHQHRVDEQPERARREPDREPEQQQPDGDELELLDRLAPDLARRRCRSEPRRWWSRPPSARRRRSRPTEASSSSWTDANGLSVNRCPAGARVSPLRTRGAHAVEDGGHASACGSARTAAANASPRAPKLANMS